MMSKVMAVAFVAQASVLVEASFQRFDMSSDMPNHHFGVREVLEHEKQTRSRNGRHQPKLHLTKQEIGERLTKIQRDLAANGGYNPSAYPVRKNRAVADSFVVQDVLRNQERNMQSRNAVMGKSITENLYPEKLSHGGVPNHHFLVKDVMAERLYDGYRALPSELTMQEIGERLTQNRHRNVAPRRMQAVKKIDQSRVQSAGQFMQRLKAAEQQSNSDSMEVDE